MMDICSHITGLQHLGLPTGDMEKTVSFYESLGFQVVYATVNDGCLVRFLKLKNICIETYETDAPAMEAGAWNHVAIDVDDIQSVWQAVHEAGFVPVEKEIQSLPFWSSGIRYFNLVGPNHETVEFSQML